MNRIRILANTNAVNIAQIKRCLIKRLGAVTPQARCHTHQLTGVTDSGSLAPPKILDAHLPERCLNRRRRKINHGFIRIVTNNQIVHKIGIPRLNQLLNQRIPCIIAQVPHIAGIACFTFI